MPTKNQEPRNPRSGRSTTLDIRNFFGGHSVMVAVRPDKEGPVIPTREELFKKASNIPSTPVAVEAFWDGDTAGWFVVLTMIYSKRASFFGNRTFCEYDLAAMRGSDGDLRLFNGNAPPWPEAHFASEVGEELAKYYEVPFYFASPNQPEDACPRWWEQEKAYPCRVCGIPLLQRHFGSGKHVPTTS